MTKAGEIPKSKRGIGSLLSGVKTRFQIAGELLIFLWEGKLWWLAPMVFILLIVGVLLLLAQSSAIAPFIYTLF
ncbi:MAG: DUF5989 family protein [Candidatus Methylomirabilales bacterium]